jgi:hypothetical protein
LEIQWFCCSAVSDTISNVFVVYAYKLVVCDTRLESLRREMKLLLQMDILSMFS